ncbi:RNA-binding domain-containing protein [Massilibacteroides vaginae]|uniref:RNA-binding domain-containing protein n=1 Tax=Massilibacteroides vaginae TaxID=1673718 RepID=UPI000A1CF04A|nr:RNA-binding domain-containing protein [Massilibacteroides vaginae]
MNNTTLKEILDHLLAMDAETELVEFKEAKNTFDFNKLGQYFSALSNEANLKRKSTAWLVFGVENKEHAIVGTKFRSQRKDLDHLKGEIANKTTNRITFVEIHEKETLQGRVILFEIPPAPKGIPVAFSGHYYGRDGEELVPLNLEEIERIRSQANQIDWSAQIIEDATINDLDKNAIKLARKNYKSKHADKKAEVDQWDDITFLNKAKITLKGKITRTAIILLGKDESEHYINPSEAKIRWILKDDKGIEKDYLIVSCPFLLAVDKVYNKIRNLKYRYLQEGTLFPEEMDQYEPFSIREAINNCIAHQDYTKRGRINVVEMPDQLVFTNLGEFIPGSIESVIQEDAPEELYRNQFLVTAMLNLKMVDTIGSGIRKMFNYQRDRLFPMPEYDLSNGRVSLTLIGKVINENFARLLTQRKDLSLSDVMLLDRIQKKKMITREDEKTLRQKKLIEGRRPNYFLSIDAAQKLEHKADYSKNKAFDKQYYLDFILKAINEHNSMTRAEIDELLWDKLPQWMNDIQRKNKVMNLLTELRSDKKIENIGTTFNSNWILKK